MGIKEPLAKISVKLKMLNLYNRYISAFFKQRKHHHANRGKKLQEAHNSLCNDNSIIVTKPDKGNGVVVLNRTDYVSKMEDILSDAGKFSLSSNNDNLQNHSPRPSQKLKFLNNLKS